MKYKLWIMVYAVMQVRVEPTHVLQPNIALSYCHKVQQPPNSWPALYHFLVYLPSGYLAFHIKSTLHM